MKTLAEFIMRGRPQAALVAIVCVGSLFLSWVGAAAVALVLLRHGLNAAAPVLLAALVPAALWAVQVGEVGPLATLCCVVVVAWILRATRSWPVLLAATPWVVSVWCLGFMWLAPEFVERLLAQLETVSGQFFEQLNAQRARNDLEPLASGQAPTRYQLMGVFGLMQVMTTVLSLMLARWWQGLLYNPGGFRAEMHNLRLGRLQVVMLVAVMLLLSQSENYGLWSWMFALPVLMAGVTLVHGLAGNFGVKQHWLLGFYLALILLRPLAPLLMMLAIVDSALDFRQRWRPGSDDGET